MSETKQYRKDLSLLTALNYLNYIDRYVLAAVLVSLQRDLGLSDLQAGLLATAFMIPYMFTAPLFGWLGDHKPRPKLMAFGGWLWSGATVLSGLSQNFISLFSSRFFLGLGESAFTTISIPYLSDKVPEKFRGRALAIFSSAVPVGAAIGFVAGGLISQHFGWRTAFFLVGFPGVLLSFLIFRLREVRLKVDTKKYIAREVIRFLTKNKPYILSVFGYCAYTFVVGGIAHWIPSFIQRFHGLDEAKSNLLFGGVAVVAGLIGTLLGGWWGDRLTLKNKPGHLFVSSLSMLLSFPVFAFCVYTENFNFFVLSLIVTQFLFFLSTSPINVALLDTIPAEFRTSAMAIAIFMIHILGDAVSAPLIGYLSDLTGSLRLGILLCLPMIFVSAFFWWLALRAKKVLLNSFS